MEEETFFPCKIKYFSFLINRSIKDETALPCKSVCSYYSLINKMPRKVSVNSTGWGWIIKQTIAPAEGKQRRWIFWQGHCESTQLNIDRWIDI